MTDENQENLRSLCKIGAEAVRAKRYEAVKFHLFGTAEEEFVRAEMAVKYPDVKFFCCTTLPPRDAPHNEKV